MNTLVLAARLLLALVFAAAGAAKLLDLQASRDTVEAFGVPRRLARAAGTALPFAEIACAIAILVQPSARWGALAALLLLVVFSGGVGTALSQGHTPACNCFGQVSSEAISWRTLARNAVIALVAVFAIVKSPGSSLDGWTRNLAAADLVSALSVLALALAVLFALRAHRIAAEAARALASRAPDPAGQAGLAVGALAPDFTLPDLDGTPTTLADLTSRGLPLLLVFANPTCGPCSRLLPNLERWSLTLADRLTIAVVESLVPNPAIAAAQLDSWGEVVCLVERQIALAATYGAMQTPTAFLIDRSGRITAPATVGGHSIERLVRAELRTEAVRAGGAA